MALPETPDPYIDWLLLSREATQMDFPNDPSFKRQMRIFLQSRTLLMVKYDSVDSQIEVTDDDIEKRYEEQFTPRFLVQKLVFENEEQALAAWQNLADGQYDAETLAALATAEGGPVQVSESWLRPKNIDQGWVALLSELEAGSVLDPEQHAKGKTLYYLKDRLGGDDEDLELFRNSIRRELWKEEEDRLTKELIEELRVKYEVKVDEERLAAIDINAPMDTFSDDPVITTNREDVSEKEFMLVMERLKKNRPTALEATMDDELAEQYKKEVAFNIIAQSVTNWESLDRHYEEKEPFKWAYEFSYNHRLGTMVEQRLFLPKAEVNDEELLDYYQEHLDVYKQPKIVKLFIIDETQAPVNKIWAEVAVGKKFTEVLGQYMERLPSAQEVPANHLDPEVKPVVDKLSVGETSPVFQAQGIQVVVHLVEITPEKPIPFERVKDMARTDLKKKKLNMIRQEYLDQLRANSSIEVSPRQWKSIQKELGGA